MTQNVENTILRNIQRKGRGWVFTGILFRNLGKYQAVRKALQRLTEQGRIHRVARGIYHYPKRHPHLGDLAPTPEQIAKALAGREGLRIQPSGAYAANLLGLSEQVPARAVFLTDGKSQKLKIGRQEIILQQTTPKNMATAGKVSGLVIQALRYLGQKNVDQSVIDRLKTRLTKEDRKALLDDVKYAPAWIGQLFQVLATDA